MSGMEHFHYRKAREILREAVPARWATYYRGHLAVARREFRDIDFVARLCYGLQMAGRALLMQRRNAEGIIEYMLYPLSKLTTEDFDEAMQLTAPHGSCYVGPIEHEGDARLIACNPA